MLCAVTYPKGGRALARARRFYLVALWLPVIVGIAAGSIHLVGRRSPPAVGTTWESVERAATFVGVVMLYAITPYLVFLLVSIRVLRRGGRASFVGSAGSLHLAQQ